MVVTLVTSLVADDAGGGGGGVVVAVARMAERPSHQQPSLATGVNGGVAAEAEAERAREGRTDKRRSQPAILTKKQQQE